MTDKPTTLAGKISDYSDAQLSAVLDALSNDLPNGALRIALNEASRRLNN